MIQVQAHVVQKVICILYSHLRSLRNFEARTKPETDYVFEDSLVLEAGLAALDFDAGLVFEAGLALDVGLALGPDLALTPSFALASGFLVSPVIA